MGGVRYCLVEGCWSSSNPKMSLFCFPRDPERCKAWVEFAGNKPSRYSRICALHFSPDSFRTPENLKPTAVPTLRRNHSPSAKFKPSREAIPSHDLLKETLFCSSVSDIERTEKSNTSSPEECCPDSVSPLNPERNDGETYKEDLLKNMKQQLCRICGMRSEVLSSIVRDDAVGEENYFSLEKKIETYLPIKLSTDDGLPFTICSKCLGLVESWHELYVSCLAADSVLRKMFGTEKYEVAEKKEKDETGDIRVLEDSTEVQPYVSREQHMVQSRVDAKESEDKGLTENSERNGRDSGLKEEHSSTNEDLLIDITFAVGLFYNQCKYCNQSFLYRREFLQHRKQCALESTLCHICGKTVSRRRRFNAHFEKHVLTSVLCEKCGSQLASNRSLIAHTKQCFENQQKYFCEPCCRVFPLKAVFKAHQKGHERRKRKFKSFSSECCGEEGFICPVCNSCFEDKFSLIAHMNSINKSICLKCKKLLQNEREVLRHTCKRWLCRFCSFQSSDWKLKHRHELLHKTNKEFTCKSCGSKFPTFWSFSHHQRIHNPVPFLCGKCGKQFRSRNPYRSHMQKHEGVKFQCLICNQEYSSWHSLYNHRRKFHCDTRNTSI